MPPTPAEVERFLAEHHGRPVGDVERLTGGHWSAAFGYRLGDDELVARFGADRDWFEVDRKAMAYAGDALPVPEVLAIGDSPFGGAYAISRRRRGRFLEDIAIQEADRARPMLRALLGALRDAPPPSEPTDGSWRDWLLDGLTDDPTHPTAGWHEKLASHRHAARTFAALERRLHELVPTMPERRDLVHGDLLHRNVLVNDDASRVTAVFSWKCSTRGDHLFDAAWCTFWGDTFHPGIAALDAFALMADGDDAALRHHCYELHIGATHLGWYAWTDDAASMARIEVHLRDLLARGPRSR